MNIKKRSKRQNVEASKNEFDAVRKALNDKLYDALAEYMEGVGFDLNEISEYSVIDIRKADDGRMVVEVRAELDFYNLVGLLNVLDPIIQKYDKAAYFEPVSPGIAEAYIDLDYKESPKDWLDDVVDALDKYEGTVTNNDGTTISVEFNNSRMLNKFADALNLDDSNVSDTEDHYVAYVPVTKIESATSIDESIDSEYDHNETVERSNHKYSVRYNSIEGSAVNIFLDFKFIITRADLEDNSEYAWCKGEEGTVKCYRGEKLVHKTFYSDADDMNVDKSEWCDIIIDECINLLEQMNHSIERRYVHNSTSVMSRETPESAKYKYDRRHKTYSEDEMDEILRAISGDRNAIKSLKSKGYMVVPLHNPLSPAEVGTWEVTDLEVNKVFNYDNTLSHYSKYVKDAEVSECTDIESASYGGAYDIEDDQYFTRDDIVEFGTSVCETLSEIYQQPFDIQDIYMDGQDLHLEVVSDTGDTGAADVHVDMRKIRLPKDLFKYKDSIVEKLREELDYLYAPDIINSSDTIEAGPYDYPEPPIDPPEPKEYDELEEIEYVETAWRDLKVTVDTDGFWEYENTYWAKSTDDDSGNWHSYEHYSIIFRDPESVVEDIDDLVEPYIPRQSGVYSISADFTLQYDITGLYADREYYPDGSYDEEIFDDDMDVTLNRSKSEIKNFKATKIS